MLARHLFDSILFHVFPSTVDLLAVDFRSLADRCESGGLHVAGHSYWRVAPAATKRCHFSRRANVIATICLSRSPVFIACLLYTSDAADDMQCVDLGGRRIIKKKK